MLDGPRALPLSLYILGLAWRGILLRGSAHISCISTAYPALQWDSRSWIRVVWASRAVAVPFFSFQNKPESTSDFAQKQQFENIMSSQYQTHYTCCLIMMTCNYTRSCNQYDNIFVMYGSYLIDLESLWFHVCTVTPHLIYTINKCNMWWIKE